MDGRLRAKDRITLAGLVCAGAAAALAQPAPYQIGQEFPPFEAVDASTGAPFHLTGLRGKIVLVEFWATWCGPCRAELPNVKKAFEQYHALGFEIISISLDQDIDKCKTFCQTEKLTWHHIIEGGGWKTRLAQEYRIRGIPTAILLDPHGIVVETRARGKRLFEAIEQALERTPPLLEPDPQPEPIGKSKAEIGRQRAEVMLARAARLIEQEKHVPAAAVYRAIQRKYPKTEAAATAAQRLENLLADAEIAAEIKQAEKEKQRGDERKKIASLLSMARSLAQVENYAAARQYYQRIIDEYPTSAAAKTAQEELARLPS